MNEDLNRIRAYCQQNHVLTLCAHHQSESWAASLFYVLAMEASTFYIMTSPGTRHGRIMTENPDISGTISDQTEEVAILRGLQFSGIVSQLTEPERTQALEQYQNRFPAARRHTEVLWKIKCREMKLTDNTAGFGTKYYWMESSPQTTII